MARNSDDDFEIIVFQAPLENQNDELSMGNDVDSVISPNSSLDGANYEESSEQSNESTIPAVDQEQLEYLMRWSEYLAQLRTNPKYIADLHAKATSQGELGEIVKFINSPGAADVLREYFNFTEYNNEMHGIFIQLAVKEFKQNWGFDEANFPFDDSGGPQRGKLPFGYIYKYWVGKADKSYKMRKFYTEQGYAIIVVFRDPTSPTASPSASAEIKVNQTPPNKKPRVGNNSPFKSSDSSSEISSPNSPSISNGNNTNYSGSVGSTNYSQQSPALQPNFAIGPNNNTNNNNNNSVDLLSPEHLSNRIDSLSLSVDDLAGRVTTLELQPASNQTILLTAQQRTLCGLIIRVLRANGNRHKLGSPLATKVRKLLGAPVSTQEVNKLLYKVLEILGIVQLQDDEWVLIDEEKAKQFEQ